jgi:esterase/lipase superfamily enzyme
MLLRMMKANPATILKGPILLERFKKLKHNSREDIAYATGYFSITVKGIRRTNLRAFYLALLEAKGVRLGDSNGEKRQTECLDFKARVNDNGSLVLKRSYTEKAGFKAGDKVEVIRQGNFIKISLPYSTRARDPGDSSKMDNGFRVTVWFATNRLPQGHKFGNVRNKRVTYGKADVYVPRAHRFGETGSNFIKRLMRYKLADDNLSLLNAESLDWQDFINGVRSRMAIAREDGYSPHALLYLHGYNTNFNNAAIRAAQLHVDLKVSGATAFFSWPSRGQLHRYLADESTIEASEGDIKNFLKDFASQCNADKVHVIAHSMGNRGLLRALQRIASQSQSASLMKFGQIFLAAPDVDRDLFLELSHLYSEYCERATLYASSGDLALAASVLLHGAPRAGYFMPYTVVDGVDTVIVPKFNVDILDHGYYAAAEALLHDIYDLILNNKSPNSRQRIIPFSHESLDMWEFSL